MGNSNLTKQFRKEQQVDKFRKQFKYVDNQTNIDKYINIIISEPSESRLQSFYHYIQKMSLKMIS